MRVRSWGFGLGCFDEVEVRFWVGLKGIIREKFYWKILDGRVREVRGCLVKIEVGVRGEVWRVFRLGFECRGEGCIFWDGWRM